MSSAAASVANIMSSAPELILGDRPKPSRPDLTLPLVLVLDHLRSAFNTGNIFRLAEATRATAIYTAGYTPTPPHDKLAKTARGCDVLVPARNFPTALEAIQELKRQGYTVYAVETVANATSPWDTTFRFPAALVLGNEALGIAPEALAACDFFVSLPALGQKNSINVGNAGAVVIYQALHQYLEGNNQ